MSAFTNLTRSRNQQETKNVYNPDLGYAQAADTGELYGQGAPGAYADPGGGQDPWTPEAGGGGTSPGIGSATAPYRWGSGGSSGNRTAAGGADYGFYSGMLGSEGYTPEEKDAILGGATNAVRARYSGASDALSNRQATSGNTAGFAAGQAELARGEGRELGDVNRQTVIDFAKEKQRRREAGGEGMARLYGGESAYTANLLGQRGRLASLTRRTYTHGAGTGGAGGVSMSGGGGMG